jgi:NAD+ kinase
VEAAGWLEAHGCTPIVEARSAAAAGVAGRWETVPRDRIGTGVDVVIAFGGDGTLLDAANAIIYSGETPLIGVNLGTLGFLTEVGQTDMLEALEALIAGHTHIETRQVIEGRIVSGGNAPIDRLALNDVIVTRGALARMIEVDVEVDGQFVCHVRADGVIVATATGSTAYNLSAGGPIVHPSADAVVLTPIAPHALSQRPLVLPASARIDLRPIMDARSEIIARFDGQFGLPLSPGSVVTVTRAPRVLRLLRTSARTHFDVLREKLKWANP